MKDFTSYGTSIKALMVADGSFYRFLHHYSGDVFDWDFRFSLAGRGLTIASRHRHGEVSFESLAGRDGAPVVPMSAYDVARDFKLSVTEYLGGSIHIISASLQSSRVPSDAYRVHVLLINRWLLIPPLGLVVLWLLHRAQQARLRLQRVANHQCVNCGYDLRATPNRCPECGTIPKP